VTYVELATRGDGSTLRCVVLPSIGDHLAADRLGCFDSLRAVVDEIRRRWSQQPVTEQLFGGGRVEPGPALDLELIEAGVG